MSRRQKIIVSVTGIFLVLLILTGLTFAFFLTQIRGNDKTNSISVTTANLILEYGDGNSAIILSNLMPGDPIPTKTFTVTNKGNAIINNYKVYLENVINQLELKDDLKYTLTCKSYKTTDTTVDFSTLTEDGTCTGATSTTFPSVMSVIATNTIAEGYTHRYELKVEYIYQDFDQSIDMNKLVQAKVNIYDEQTKFLATEIMDNAISGVEGRTVYTLPNQLPTKIAKEPSYIKITDKLETSAIHNPTFMWLVSDNIENLENFIGTSISKCTSDLIGLYIMDPIFGFSGIKKIEGCDGDIPIITQEVLEYEKVLSYTQDNLGTSYFYRGKVEDNYVNFADMCWRIVRINGDGSIKLILEDAYAECDDNNISEKDTVKFTGNWSIGKGNFGYVDEYLENGIRYTLLDYLHGNKNEMNSDSQTMVNGFKKFQAKFTKEELSKLKSGNWCYNNRAFSYANSQEPLTEEQKKDIRSKLGNYQYESNQRLMVDRNSTLDCRGDVFEDFDDNVINPTPMYVGTLTADEVVYSGGTFLNGNFENYLYNDYLKRKNNVSSISFLTLSPLDLDYYNEYNLERSEGIIVVSRDVSRLAMWKNDAVSSNHLRPAVSLNFNVTVSTNSDIVTYGQPGTINNPYVIN